MLNVYYDCKLGSISCINSQGELYKLEIYKANCLGAVVYEYEEEGVPMVQLYSFWNDKTHLTNCLGLTGDYKGENSYQDQFRHIVFYGHSKEVIELYKYFTKANWNEGTTITIVSGF